ncbi:Hypothetical protein SRAE_2000155100 [Strongyloides ratti]|uniref:Uncharacterized protein n=1 Tax=Strongyloides ratti TaxID=34506 RepID=A0A090LHC3_STRRB|nr:Hypothetical protein SRAE_2000155100 [Strongyloides ratti]CEF66885.1 Hypothetical protein SRAE_2000155100 [Strongyloides ratti]
MPSGHCHSAETFACSLTGLSHPSLFISQRTDYDRSSGGSPTDGLSTLRLTRTLGQRRKADRCSSNRQILPILSHLETGLQEPATTPGDSRTLYVKFIINILILYTII